MVAVRVHEDLQARVVRLRVQDGAVQRDVHQHHLVIGKRGVEVGARDVAALGETVGVVAPADDPLAGRDLPLRLELSQRLDRRRDVDAGPTGGFETFTCFASGGALMKWLCASTKPGSSALPSRSRTTVFGPFRVIASSFAPAKAMRPFSPTTAST